MKILIYSVIAQVQLQIAQVQPHFGGLIWIKMLSCDWKGGTTE